MKMNIRSGLMLYKIPPYPPLKRGVLKLNFLKADDLKIPLF
jgi:hypothetical protein